MRCSVAFCSRPSQRLAFSVVTFHDSQAYRNLDMTQERVSFIFAKKEICCYLSILASESESESELFTGDTSKDNHSPGPVFREVSP